MTFTHKIDIEVFICLSALVVVSGFTVWKSNKNSLYGQLTVPIIAKNTVNAAVAVPIPSLRTNTVSHPSPDGKKKLWMTTAANQNGIPRFTLKTTDGDGTNEQFVYTATMSAEVSMSIPFNTWSPDNKYVFVRNNSGDALVFKANGEEIVPGQAYFDVKDIFSAGERTDLYHETTGWASETLLILNTLKADNTKGASYWFEVPSKAVIQLSSQF